MLKRALVLLAIGLLSFASAVTLAELQLVTATSLQLNPAVRLPSGSLRAVGEGTEAIIARVPGSRGYTDWEVYAATGIAARLQPAFVQQITTAFAVNDYFLVEQTEETQDDETHTRYSFQNDAGEETLLYVIRTPAELIWLVAKGR
jgi:hypothetical protein